MRSRSHLPIKAWSSRSELWNELATLARGLQWTRVNFELNHASRLPRDIGGVYLICAGAPCKPLDKIGTYTILYAGKVTGPERSLRDRFKEHRTRPQPKLKSYLKCYYRTSVHFWYAEIPDKMRIDRMEVLLLETFNPPCNRRRAPGTDVLLASIGAVIRIGGSNRTQTP